ncbi:MAG: PAS domain-containing protein [Cytophagales bacterium]|nr:PAS domain-containing protein [Cytophagales bacterium]MDW8384898.1 PAS domain-containing protein [Flammeovirgaceae bacterium]
MFNLKKLRFTIGQKVLGANIVVLGIFTVNIFYSFSNFNRLQELIAYSFENVIPSLEAIEDFKIMINNSRSYITNWVYLPENKDDKEDMKRILVLSFPTLKDKISILKKSWKKPTQASEVDSIIIQYDEVLRIQQRIMQTLAEEEDYNDFSKKFFAEEAINKEIIPASYTLVDRLEFLIKDKENEKNKLDRQIHEILNSLQLSLIIFSISLVSVCIILSFLAFQQITIPISYFNEKMSQLSRGIMPNVEGKIFQRIQNDEIGDMLRGLRRLVSSLKATAAFAHEIGSGNYQATYQPLSEEDELGMSLINMRNSLAKLANEAIQRNWVNKELAHFGDILRRNHDNLSVFYSEILSNLVQVTSSNQGAVFIINDFQKETPYMELQACYAWDKEKFLEKKIYKGEGLAGQAWQEGNTIYITDVPENYIQISSGLGRKKPTNVLIVPIKVNELIYGVFELASFHHYEPYQIEFVEKVAESFASTLTSVRVNERTRRLLEESTRLTNQMREQEEALRRNIEQLLTTQQELKQQQLIWESKEKLLNNTRIVIETNHNFRILEINKLLTEKLGFNRADILQTPLAMLFLSEEKFNRMKKELEKGKIFTGGFYLFRKDRTKIWLRVDATPILKHQQELPHYVFYLEDVAVLKEEQQDTILV